VKSLRRGQGGKVVRRKLNGVLLLDKPIGLSSNQALQAVRRLLRAEKGGHTGTLDPLATGLLPLCFGEATKFAGELLDADKTYEATLRLGVTTDTGDAEGREIKRREVTASRAEVIDALTHFLGEIEQIPPMYSALKRDGKPLYEYARAGIELERAARQVTIRKLELTDWTESQLSIEVTCSKGTYIRTLAEDLGERLNCGAHLIALRRTATGGMTVTGAKNLTELEAMSEAERDAQLLPTDALICHLPILRLDAAARSKVLHGQAFTASYASLNGVSPAPTGKDKSNPERRVRLIDDDGVFLGLGQLNEDGQCQPHRLIATN
jgi:tRNA pseudouridine55 synthase